MKRQLPEMPPGIAALDVDARGWPVPWFVSWTLEACGPDFRVVTRDKVVTALRFRLCWCCGRKIGAESVFVVGPMCGVNRISSEPPSCGECAAWAVTACPFLLNPNMRRMSSQDGDREVGVMVKRNPGVTLLWETRDWEPFQVDGGGILIDLGDPTNVAWIREGRNATRAEVDDSIAGGIGQLRELAAEDGPEALAELARRERELDRLKPGAVT